MPKAHEYFVYILASRSRTLYIGVTNDLVARLRQHRAGKADAFTTRYAVHRLVYFERFLYIDKAIAREKYLKHWTRAEKLALISKANPTWVDLSEMKLRYRGDEQEADPPPFHPNEQRTLVRGPDAAKDDNI